MLRRTLPIILLASVAGAQASDYQWELNGFLGHAETPTTDQDSIGLSGTYYFSPVETRSHPLAEAAFLERRSSVNLNHTRTESSAEDRSIQDDNISYIIRGNDSTRDVSNFNAELYLPGDLFYLGVGARRGEVDTGSSSWSNTAWNASLGLTPVDGLLVYSRFFEDQDLDEHWNLNAKYVFDHFGPTIAVETNYDYDDYMRDRLSVSLDYYIDRTLSVGYQRTDSVGDGPDNRLDGHRLDIRKFFGDQWSLSGFYSKSGSFDGVGVEASFRF